MAIDIEALSEAELLDLNFRIVERLQFLHQLKTYDAMLQLSIGERAEFEDRYGERIIGTMIRHNRKSVTVHSDDGRHWNVSPGLLHKAGSGKETKGGNLHNFDRK
jgi:hypothetical protein